MKNLLLLLILGLCAIPLQAEDKQEETKLLTVQRTHAIHSLYFSGIIQPIRSAIVASPVEGIVKKRQFTYGDMVEKDQPLFHITSHQVKKDYQAALNAYLTNKENFFTAQAQFEGTKQLWDLGIVSKNDFDQSKRDLYQKNVGYLQALYTLNEVLDSQKNEKKDELTQLELSDVQKVSDALQQENDQRVVVAPKRGVALLPPASSRSGAEAVEEGVQVSAGQGLLTVGDLSGISLNIQVTEVDVGQVKEGQKVHVTGVAFPGIELLGQVTFVEIQASAEGGGLPTFAVKVEVEKLTKEQQKVIKMGMSAKVQLDIDTPGVIQIPITSVINDRGVPKVKVKKADGTTELRTIEAGKTSAKHVVVLSGLKEGEQIVLSHSL